MNIEIIRADGELYAFTSVQNEWTGNYTHSFRKVRISDNDYVITLDGRTVIVSQLVKEFKMYEDRVEMWRKWYRDTYNRSL